jgi:hypothetical protein
MDCNIQSDTNYNSENHTCGLSARTIHQQKQSGGIPKIPYILEYNPHSGFSDFFNRKKLVRGSNLHLSFKRPLPTGRLIE